MSKYLKSKQRGLGLFSLIFLACIIVLSYKAYKKVSKAGIEDTAHPEISVEPPKKTTPRYGNCVRGDFPANGVWSSPAQRQNQAKVFILIENYGMRDAVFTFEGNKWGTPSLIAFVHAGQVAQFPVSMGDYTIRITEGEGWCTNLLDYQLKNHAKSSARIHIDRDSVISYESQNTFQPNLNIKSPNALYVETIIVTGEVSGISTSSTTQGKLRTISQGSESSRSPSGSVTSSGKTLCEIRIPRSQDKMFYVNGVINNVPVLFMVDTGASSVVIDARTARNAGLSKGRPTIFKTAGGNVRGITTSSSITVGGLSAANVEIGVNPSNGDAIALLGQTFLSKFSVTQHPAEMIISKPNCSQE